MRNEITLPKLASPVSNQIFIEIKDTSFEIERESGVVVKSAFDEGAWSDSKGYSVSDFLPTTGVVAAVPKSIYPLGFDFKTDLEIEIGDEVFWSAHIIEGCSVLVCSGRKYLKIDYHQLLARRRNGEIYPLNGYVLLTPVPEIKKALAYSETKPTSDKWDIFKVPDKYPVSLVKKRNVPFIWEVGERVLTMVHGSPLRLEGNLNKTLDQDIYCVFWWMVLCDVKK